MCFYCSLRYCFRNEPQRYEKKCPVGHFFNESFSVADDFNNKVNAST